MSNELIEPPEPGVYADVSMETYHTWDAASNSRLTRLMRSPAHLKSYIEKDQGETKAMRVGRMVHKAVLEPEEFEASYHVLGRCQGKKNDGDRCTYDAKVVRENGEFCGTHDPENGLPMPDGVNVVKESEFSMAQRIRENVFAKRSTEKMLTGGGDVEISIVWEDDITGVTCKARLDRYSPDVPGGAIVDFKTARDANPQWFREAVFKRGYHRQARFYLRGANQLGYDIENFIFIAAEKEEPYAVGPPYILDEIDMDAVDDQLTELLELYRDCKEADHWPGYPDASQYISIPTWAWKKVDEQSAEISRLRESVDNGRQ